MILDERDEHLADGAGEPSAAAPGARPRPVSALSPVVCRPMTTQLPSASASRARRTTTGTFMLTHRSLKKRWWRLQYAFQVCPLPPRVA